MFCRWRDISVWKSAWMTSAQSWSGRHHWTWADVIRANFQRVISRYIQNISTCLFHKAQRGLRTIFIKKSKPKYAYLPSKIVAVWIDRFCVRYDWWRRLQPTSSVSPVWIKMNCRKWLQPDKQQECYIDIVINCLLTWISKWNFVGRDSWLTKFITSIKSSVVSCANRFITTDIIRFSNV